MDLTITIPAESEARVLDAMCRTAGHPPCDDQPGCAQAQVLGMVTNRVTEYELFKAKQAAASAVPPLTLGG